MMLFMGFQTGKSTSQQTNTPLCNEQRPQHPSQHSQFFLLFRGLLLRCDVISKSLAGNSSSSGSFPTCDILDWPGLEYRVRELSEVYKARIERFSVDIIMFCILGLLYVFKCLMVCVVFIMIWKCIVRKPLHLDKERVWAAFLISTQGVIHLKSAALTTKDDSDYDDHDHDGDVNFCLNITITRWRSSLFPTCFCIAARMLALMFSGGGSSRSLQTACSSDGLAAVGSFLGVMAGSLHPYYEELLFDSGCTLLGLITYDMGKKEALTNLCCQIWKKTRISWLLESILEILCFFICISCISILEICFPSFNMYPWFEKHRLFQPIRFPPTHLALQGGTRLDERHATFGSFGTQESCCVGGLEGGAQRNFRVGQARVVKQADLDFTPPEN